MTIFTLTTFLSNTVEAGVVVEISVVLEVVAVVVPVQDLQARTQLTRNMDPREVSSKQAWQRDGLEKKRQTSGAGVVKVLVVVLKVLDVDFEVVVLVKMQVLHRTGQVVRANWPKPPRDAQWCPNSSH